MSIRCFTIFRIHKYSVISFSRYKEYLICKYSFSKFADVLPAFTCAKAIGNFLIICLKVNILSLSSCFASYLALGTIVVSSSNNLITFSFAF